ncbi:homoserine dehydrogenase [Bacillus tianshenii]|uniref:homoserine dehydrogenase n=1 Tax=Sutcliffiella tianshenii TaxID=1463404 RepID=UPI001CD38D16|nr:homoserine dehydrogenase [Bacillus tianshenii]MCA1319246.1 homoserine dehydrogenase [Bacillus tianshenii]
MSKINVALLGYGTVGKGVYRTIESHQDRLQRLLGKEVNVVAILVRNIEKHVAPDEHVLLTTNFEDILSLPELHIVIDAIVGREPGFSYLKKAIEKGCHVVTANKEMFAFHGTELQALALEKGVGLGYEATVAGGIPIIQTIRQLLSVNHFLGIEAILNGTTNFILTNMRKLGNTFAEALQLAKENGYAESDPTNDIEGYDAQYKGMVLSQLIYGGRPSINSVKRKGITHIQPNHMKIAEEADLRFKHVVTLSKSNREIQCKVEPVLVTDSHPFYQVEGVQNSVSLTTDLLGTLQLQGPGAGMFPTASAILEDIIQLENEHKAPPAAKDSVTDQDALSQWVIFGGYLESEKLGSDIKIIEKLDDTAWVIEAEYIPLGLSHSSDVIIYPLKGKYEKKKLPIKV